jgi:hypothetical protein
MMNEKLNAPCVGACNIKKEKHISNRNEISKWNKKI